MRIEGASRFRGCGVMSRVQGCGVARSPQDPYEGVEPAKYTEIPRKRKHSHLSDCPVGCSYGPEQRPESNARYAQVRIGLRRPEGRKKASKNRETHHRSLDVGFWLGSHNPQKQLQTPRNTGRLSLRCRRPPLADAEATDRLASEVRSRALNGVLLKDLV